MKRIGIVVTTFVYSVHLLLWYFVVRFIFLIKQNGLFSIFEDFFGSWSLFLGVVIAVLVIASPVYLRKWVWQNKNNRELKISVLSLLITLLFLVLSAAMFYLTAMQFRDFTSEKWQRYPNERYIMIDDLKEEHGIIGMEYNEVVELLGKPDKLTSAGYLSYSYGYGDIEISLDANNCVIEIYE